MRAPLRLEDSVGVIFEAKETTAGITIYGNVAGGVLLTTEQREALVKWLDDGASSVWKGEVARVERQMSEVRDQARRLVQALKGAWWLEAADAYESLRDWVGE